MKKEILDLLDLDTPQRYTLSIRLSSDGFCFSLYDHKSSGSIVPFYYKTNTVASELANVKEVFEDLDELLKCKFFKVYVMYDTDRTVTVPYKVFDEDDMTNIYKSCYESGPGEILLYSVSETMDCVLVFPFNKYVKQFIDEHFNDVIYIPSSCPVMNRCAFVSREKQYRCLFICVEKYRIKTLAFDKGNLVFVNSFECECDSDRLFYIMNAWKAVSFSQTEDFLMIVSDEMETDSLKASLECYIGNIGYLTRNEQLRSEFHKNGIKLDFDMEVLITDYIG